MSKPVKLAQFSYDASLIASTSTYDSVVKLWQRQSFGSDDARFEFIYLPHPSVVTSIHWRRPDVNEHHNGLNVLYTICADKYVRLWAPTDAHSPHDLHRVAEINLDDSIQPRSQPSMHERVIRYVFIIDGGCFEKAVQAALQKEDSSNPETHHKLDHLLEVSKRDPDLCVVLDDKGHMSAWGIDSIGCKARKEASVFNVAHVEHFEMPVLHTLGEDRPFASFRVFYDDLQDYALNLLIQRLDESITWFDVSIELFLDSAPRTNRLRHRAVWDGHEATITRIIRNSEARDIFSFSSDGEVIRWQSESTSTQALRRTCTTSYPVDCDHILLLSNGEAILTLQSGLLCLWALTPDHDEKTVSCESKFEGTVLALVELQQLQPHNSPLQLAFVAAIDEKGNVRVWRLTLPKKDQSFSETGFTFEIHDFCTVRLPTEESLVLVTTPDAARSTDFRRKVHIRETIVSCTSAGLVEAWTLRADSLRQKVRVTSSGSIPSQVNCPSKIGSSLSSHIAIVDSSTTGVSIWDLYSSGLEYQKHFPAHEPVQGLDWWSSSMGHSMLAVVGPRKITVLMQAYFDFLHNATPWILVREINTKDCTPEPIGDSAWLSDGTLVAGVGSQHFIYSSSFSPQELQQVKVTTRDVGPEDLSAFVRMENRPLAIYHPQVLYQYICVTGTCHVEHVVTALHTALKFYVPGDDVDRFLGLPLNNFNEGLPALFNGFTSDAEASLANAAGRDDADHVTEKLTISLGESLAKFPLPHLTPHDQIRLQHVVQSLGHTARDLGSLDSNALRYILSFRQNLLHTAQEPSASYREYVFALHSTTQDLLTNLISQPPIHSARLLWSSIRASGLFMWLSDPVALRQQFEAIARNEYTKTDERNPTDCALYYLALRKKQVLLGLWRMATWNREQRSTMKLLGNNFEDPRWKTAALKNAYALLGKRRFEYAASFFLLADKCQDAVNVCVQQLGDLQLGVAVARVYEGDEGPTLKHLLKERTLPEAAKTHNRWQAHWAFWMLGENSRAVRALHAPLTELIPGIKDTRPLSYRDADPAHLILYRELRHHVTNREEVITPREEWAFVMRTVRLYCRMGCHVLALWLVKNWRFLERPRDGDQRVRGEGERSGGDAKKRGISREKEEEEATSSSEDDSEEDEESEGDGSESEEDNKGKKQKPPPTQFQEPSADNLLDSFGF